MKALLNQIEKHNNFCDKYNLIDYYIYHDHAGFYQNNNFYEQIYIKEYNEAVTIEDLKELFNIKE